MSYTVLARRYRSGTFDELIGQDHIARTLKKAITSGRIAHAYLFCGTRGTGKTSTARILAKCLNCESSDSPTPEPCGKCNSCQAIARGDDIDVIEIDAASNTGVDNVRDLINNAQFRPARSRLKVYIIDEVHMLSKSAFNALLKTLEEPPEHVKFILATTEAEKVLPTILSRCQRYDFRNIPTREIAAHLKTIVKQENVNADDDALLLVAKAGAGSMRDALSLLDRLLSIGEERLTIEALEQLLGMPRIQLLFDLAEAIGTGETKSVLLQADAMITSGLSADSLVAALVDHLRNLLILRTCGDEARDLVQVPGLSPADLQKQAAKFDPVALTQDIAVLEELRRHMRQSQGGRALLDATLVRMTLADQFASIADLLGQLDGGSAKPTIRPAGSGVAPRPPAQSPAQKKNELAGEGMPSGEPRPGGNANLPATSDDDDDDLPRPGKVWDNSGPSLVELLKQHQQQETQSNVESVAPADLKTIWHKFVSELPPIGLSWISSGQLHEIGDNVAVIRVSAQHETFVKRLEQNGRRDLVHEAMSKAAERPVGVRFELDAAPAPEAASSRLAAPEPPRKPVQAAPPEPPIVPATRVTPEIVEYLRATQPLVKSLMDNLSAQIIKVEQP